MVPEALSETLPVTSLVLSLPASGGMLVDLLLETTCPVLKYLIPKDSRNAYGGTRIGPTQSLSGNVGGLLGRRYILYADFMCPK